MRTTTAATMLSILMLLSSSAVGEDTPAEPPQPEAKAAEPGGASAPLGIKIEELPDAASAKADEKPFVPPDGWRPRKRGKFIVYCRKDYNVKGTRFPAETCYDEAGIRAMVRQSEIDQVNVDQLRRICANDSACGTH